MTTDLKPSVTLYSQPTCGPCVGVEAYLKRSDIPYVKVDITQDPAALERVKSLGYSGTPVIEHPDGHFGGYNPEQLEAIRVAMFATT